MPSQLLGCGSSNCHVQQDRDALQLIKSEEWGGKLPSCLLPPPFSLLLPPPRLPPPLHPPSTLKRRRRRRRRRRRKLSAHHCPPSFPCQPAPYPLNNSTHDHPSLQRCYRVHDDSINYLFITSATLTNSTHGHDRPSLQVALLVKAQQHICEQGSRPNWL